MGAAVLAGTLYAALGLYVGNLPRLIAVGLAWLPFAAGTALFAAWLWLRWERVACPRCRRPLRWGARPLFTLAGSLLWLRRCPGCGCVMGRDWKEAVEPPQLGAVQAAALLGRTAPALLAALAVGLAAAGWALDRAGQAALESVKARLRAEGFSWDLPRNRYIASDADNQAHWIRKAEEARARVPAPKGAEAELIAGFVDAAQRRPPPAKDLAAVRAHLGRHAEVFELLERAGRQREADWGIDWSAPGPLDLPFPRASSALALGALLSLRAVAQAAQPDAARAAETVTLGLRLAGAYGAYETVLGHTVRGALARQQLGAARVVLRERPANAGAWLTQLPAGDESEGFDKALQLSVLGLHMWPADLTFKDALRQALGRGRPELGTGWELVAYWPLLKLDLASFMREGLGRLRAARLPYRQSAGALERHYEEAHKGLWFFASLAYPRFTHDDETRWKAAAEFCLARAAVAAVEFKTKNARWPAEPGELPGGPWGDPFSEGELRSRPDGGELVLYSVGPDGTDDGGAPFEGKTGKGDLSWAVR